MDAILETIHKLSFMGLSALFVFQAILLMVRRKHNRVRNTMAILLLLWAFVYFSTLISMYVLEPPSVDSILREKVLVVGNIYLSFMFVFPMQVLMPGWLKWKRLLLLVLPVPLLSAVYYLGMMFLDETPENLQSYEQLFASFCHFNVWFRFVLLFSSIVYLVVILSWLNGYEQRYIDWKNQNFSDQEDVDITWMKAYHFIVAGVYLFFIFVLLTGGRLPVILHTFFVVVSFSYLTYKVLFFESPYPQNMFASDDMEERKREAEDIYVIADAGKTASEEEMNDASFETLISTYTLQIKQWMEEEKPYLYKEFKLTDVSRVLPLNRTYLSRVFNEGFGHKFNEVVRSYRIEYSKEVIRKNPSYPLYRVAEICGFSSDSTFLRAFKQVEGITPTQYKFVWNEQNTDKKDE